MQNLITRNGIYYLVKQVNGRTVFKSLRTRTKKLAEQRLKLELGKIQAGQWDQVQAPQASTIAEVCKLYTTHTARAATARTNISALLKIVQESGAAADQEAARALPLDKLSREVLRDYITRASAELGTSEQDLHRARSIFSRIRHAKSVFSRKSLELYTDSGIHIPASVHTFIAYTPALQAPRIKYRRPPEPLISATVSHFRALWATDPDCAAVFVLAYDLGMRAAEIAAACFDWIEPDGFGGHLMRICTRQDFRPKRSHERTIPIAPDILAQLQRYRLHTGRARILPGPTARARYSLITRDFSFNMRALGWSRTTYPKAAHELRKLAGCRWFTLLGPTQAQKLLGHDSLTTTQDFYAEYSAHIQALPTDYSGRMQDEKASF
jgi:integrase